jgi:MFS family permease
MWGVGTLIGPLIGGLFGELDLWNVAFLALAAIGIGLAVLVPLVLTGEREDQELEPVPVASMALLSVAALLVSVAGVVTDAVASLALVAAAALVLVGFVVKERWSTARVLPKSTFAAGPTKWIYLMITVLAIGSTVEAFVPLFGQRLGGLAPLAAGFLGAALAAGWTLGEIPSANAVRTATVRRLLTVSPLLLGAGLAVLAFTQVEAAPGWIVGLWVIALLVAGAGIGIAWPHVATEAMSTERDPSEARRAAAAINTVQLVANAFGSAIGGLAVNLGGPAATGSATLMYAVAAVIAVLGIVAARRMIRRPETPGRDGRPSPRPGPGIAVPAAAL